MSANRRMRVALVYPGDRAARATMSPRNNRFANVAAALAQYGIEGQPAVYSDEFVEEVREQLRLVDAALVWVNPIEGGRNRSVLDAMLRDVAASGVFVSAHPDIILKLGTKEVLFATRSIGWGSDVYRYLSMEELRTGLVRRMEAGSPRVLKQHRGNGGNGVWKVELSETVPAGTISDSTTLRVRHAARGSVETELTLGGFLRLCAQYFDGDGMMIDQAYQPRLVDGMVRCYLVHDRLAGFGHQAINALYPAPAGADPGKAPQPGPRLYFPPDRPEFKLARRKLELDWVPALRQLFSLTREQLPVLWDVDLLLGPRDEAGEDTYVLCEINVSSVSPFPDSALPVMAQAMAEYLGAS